MTKDAALCITASTSEKQWDVLFENDTLWIAGEDERSRKMLPNPG